MAKGLGNKVKQIGFTRFDGIIDKYVSPTSEIGPNELSFKTMSGVDLTVDGRLKRRFAFEKNLDSNFTNVVDYAVYSDALYIFDNGKYLYKITDYDAAVPTKTLIYTFATATGTGSVEIFDNRLYVSNGTDDAISCTGDTLKEIDFSQILTTTGEVVCSCTDGSDVYYFGTTDGCLISFTYSTAGVAFLGQFSDNISIRDMAYDSGRVYYILSDGTLNYYDVTTTTSTSLGTHTDGQMVDCSTMFLVAGGYLFIGCLANARLYRYSFGTSTFDYLGEVSSGADDYISAITSNGSDTLYVGVMNNPIVVTVTDIFSPAPVITSLGTFNASYTGVSKLVYQSSVLYIFPSATLASDTLKIYKYTSAYATAFTGPLFTSSAVSVIHAKHHTTLSQVIYAIVDGTNSYVYTWDYSAATGTLRSTLSNFTFTVGAYDGAISTYLYYAIQNSSDAPVLYRLPIATWVIASYKDLINSLWYVNSTILVDGYLYFTTRRNIGATFYAQIYRKNLSTGDIALIAEPTGAAATNLIVDEAHEYLYFTTTVPYVLQKMSLSTFTCSQLYSGNPLYAGATTYHLYMYGSSIFAATSGASNRLVQYYILTDTVVDRGAIDDDGIIVDIDDGNLYIIGYYFIRYSLSAGTSTTLETLGGTVYSAIASDDTIWFIDNHDPAAVYLKYYTVAEGVVTVESLGIVAGGLLLKYPGSNTFLYFTGARYIYHWAASVSTLLFDVYTEHGEAINQTVSVVDDTGRGVYIGLSRSAISHFGDDLVVYPDSVETTDPAVACFPHAHFLIAFENMMVAFVTGDSGNIASFSEPGEPTNWNNNQNFTVVGRDDDTLRGAVVMNKRLYLATDRAWFYGTYAPDVLVEVKELTRQYGCADYFKMVAGRNEFYFVFQNEMYMFNGSSFTKLTEEIADFNPTNIEFCNNKVYAGGYVFNLDVFYQKRRPWTTISYTSGIYLNVVDGLYRIESGDLYKVSSTVYEAVDLLTNDWKESYNDLVVKTVLVDGTVRPASTTVTNLGSSAVACGTETTLTQIQRFLRMAVAQANYIRIRLQSTGTTTDFELRSLAIEYFEKGRRSVI